MDPAIEHQLSELLRRAQEGDRGAYERFLFQVRHLLTALLRNQVGATGAIDDIVQETLVSIHRSRHTYDPERPIGPWLRAIALNRLRDHRRAHQRRTARETYVAESELAAPTSDQHRYAADASKAADATYLERALNELSAIQREVIWLLKFEGYSVAEIAGLTGRSVASVKVTAHRGYRALRELLSDP